MENEEFALVQYMECTDLFDAKDIVLGCMCLWSSTDDVRDITNYFNTPWPVGGT